jgi:geranylgeranyl pyrophosphate synthase
MKKLNEYLTAGRKFGFTVWCMAQNYTSIPKVITRNLQYIILFKLNDNVSINNIIKNHNTDPKRVEEVIAWVKAGDGIRYAEQRMFEYRDKALTALEAFPESTYRTSFINLVRFTTDRKK